MRRTVNASGIVVVCLLWAAMANADESVQERGERLLRAVNTQGIGSVAQQPGLSRQELEMLQMIAQLDVDGAEEALKIIERRLPTQRYIYSLRSTLEGENWSDELYADLTALRNGDPRNVDASDLYVVFIENQSTVKFDEVVIFYQQHGDPIIKMENMYGLSPEGIHMFTLGACYRFKSYAIGVFIGGNLVAKQPTDNSKGLTPADVARMHPWDADLCKDFWGIGR